MNRNKVITDPMPFKTYRKKKKQEPVIIPEEDDPVSLYQIIKISKDKKNIKSDNKRRALTLELLTEYLEDNYSELE
jgi:hypothetical protein